MNSIRVFVILAFMVPTHAFGGVDCSSLLNLSFRVKGYIGLTRSLLDKSALPLSELERILDSNTPIVPVDLAMNDLRASVMRSGFESVVKTMSEVEWSLVKETLRGLRDEYAAGVQTDLLAKEETRATWAPSSIRIRSFNVSPENLIYWSERFGLLGISLIDGKIKVENVETGAIAQIFDTKLETLKEPFESSDGRFFIVLQSEENDNQQQQSVFEYNGTEILFQKSASSKSHRIRADLILLEDENHDIHLFSYAEKNTHSVNMISIDTGATKTLSLNGKLNVLTIPSFPSNYVLTTDVIAKRTSILNTTTGEALGGVTDEALHLEASLPSRKLVLFDGVKDSSAFKIVDLVRFTNWADAKMWKVPGLQVPDHILDRKVVFEHKENLFIANFYEGVLYFFDSRVEGWWESRDSRYPTDLDQMFVAYKDGVPFIVGVSFEEKRVYLIHLF